MKKEKLLTIGITSYKRIEELKRCIYSVKTIYNDEIEVIVSEDCSPLSKEIGEAVAEVSKNVSFELKFMPNAKNLGYDMNLEAIIKKASGKFVFLISDDDAIYENSLDNLIEFLRNDETHGVLYSPFVFDDTKKLGRNHGVEIDIKPGEDNAKKYVYDPILFSGLIFRKDYVSSYSAERFKNYNYFQVYLFLSMVLKHGAFYFKNPLILCIGDGENAYGISESSGGNEILANRKSVKSNLEFNKTLIQIIKEFDIDNNTSVFKSFSKQYSLHSYTGLSIARTEGLKYYKEYWAILKKLDLKLTFIVRIYYCLLFVFGKKICDAILSPFKKSVSK